MRLVMMCAAAVAMLATMPLTANAVATAPYHKNAAGRCVGANGQFATADKCATAAAAAPAGRCRDKTTKKFVKCGTPNSESVPAAGH